MNDFTNFEPVAAPGVEAGVEAGVLLFGLDLVSPETPGLLLISLRYH